MDIERNLYYIHVPAVRRDVSLPVQFMPVTEFLHQEDACKDLWDLLTGHFKTRSKFLSIWPHVRFIALHRVEGQVAGILLVSTPRNWQIDYVVVREDMRHRGIAEALVAETVNQALSRQVPYLMLTSQPALRNLYEGRCGFTVVAEEIGQTSSLAHTKGFKSHVRNHRLHGAA